jgi:hypothetical protein
MRAGAGATSRPRRNGSSPPAVGAMARTTVSNAFDAEGKPIANTWQGIFPVYNTNEDGYAATAPVGCFKPNGYGLYDMIGTCGSGRQTGIARGTRGRQRSIRVAPNCTIWR